MDECTAPCILQLAPGPSSSGCGCLVPTLGESSRICVPTIRLNHTLLGEASTGASERCVNCSSVAKSALVPLSPQGLNGLSNPAASSAGHFIRPRGPEPPAGASGPHPSTTRDFRRELLSLSEILAGLNGVSLLFRLASVG